jgi:hypothetical protein
MNDVTYFLLGLAGFAIVMGIYGWIDYRKHVRH